MGDLRGLAAREHPLLDGPCLPSRGELLRSPCLAQQAVPLGGPARLCRLARAHGDDLRPGLGDLFVVRVAGNALDTTTHGSLQFAVNVLKVKVLVVLGHELCGAIKAAQLPDEKFEEMPSHLEEALKGIKAGLDLEGLKNLKDARALDREAVSC